MNFEVFVPVFPPGLNDTYRCGKGVDGKIVFYKTKEATEWQEKAALIVGSEAAIQEWEDDSKYYEIWIEFNNWRQDFDAPIKLVTDTISLKLGFNDKRIMWGHIGKVDSEQDGVLIKLMSYE
jgi:Holliday junction resolvase RusA-like endonuclease